MSKDKARTIPSLTSSVWSQGKEIEHQFQLTNSTGAFHGNSDPITMSDNLHSCEHYETEKESSVHRALHVLPHRLILIRYYLPGHFIE